MASKNAVMDTMIKSSDNFASKLVRLCNVMVTSNNTEIKECALRLVSIIQASRAVDTFEIIRSAGAYLFKYSEKILENNESFFLDNGLEEEAEVEAKINSADITKEERDKLIFVRDTFGNIRHYYKTLKPKERKIIIVCINELLNLYLQYVQSERTLAQM